MVLKWSRTLVNIYRVQNNLWLSCRSISRVSSVELPKVVDYMGKSYADISEGHGLEQLVRIKITFCS
ncbi:hypothetical protein Hanom_Chr07g00678831 [Helianthus anomalus]